MKVTLKTICPRCGKKGEVIISINSEEMEIKKFSNEINAICLGCNLRMNFNDFVNTEDDKKIKVNYVG